MGGHVRILSIGQVSALAGAFTGRRQKRGAAWKLVASDGLSGDSGWRWPTRAMLGGRGHRRAGGVMVLIGGAVGVVGIPASSSYTHSR
jgi:hypothetical protein